MESWVPLLEIFLKSPSPEGEASLWMQANPFVATKFLPQLLCKQVFYSKPQSSSSSSHTATVNKCMWVQTLPNAMQSRILSFLSMEHRRFPQRDLRDLSTSILQEPELDFWVVKAAQNLLQTVSNFHSSLPREIEGEFNALPAWLESLGADSEPLLQWLPFHSTELQAQITNDETIEHLNPHQACPLPSVLAVDRGLDPVEIDGTPTGSELVAPNLEIQARAARLRTRLLVSDSPSKIRSLLNEIRELCSAGEPMTVLGLIEPWEADDEVVLLLLSDLLEGNKSYTWSSQVLCSVLLPKLLMLREPASRTLIAAMVKHCKLHPRAAVDALLFPLVLIKDGINVSLCDVLTRVVKECLHPSHVSAFLQGLLAEESVESKSRLVCLPRHRCLVSDELVWTEPLFSLLQNVLNHDVYLTRDAVERVVARVVGELAERFSKSLKFGSFLMCLVSKCGPLLKCNKDELVKAVERTNTFMTKSILSKLCGP